MKIYTRGGDGGKTALIGGERRLKNDLRIEAYGTVDEAGAFIGQAMSFLDPRRDADVITLLLEVSQMLWDVGADLAAPNDEQGRYTYKTPSDAAGRLEPFIDRYKEEADAVTKFVLRAGSTASATLHVACTVVRRAERCTVSLMERETIHKPTLQYLNRLSDLLFVLARAINARDERRDVFYEHSSNVF